MFVQEPVRVDGEVHGRVEARHEQRTAGERCGARSTAVVCGPVRLLQKVPGAVQPAE